MQKVSAVRRTTEERSAAVIAAMADHINTLFEMLAINASTLDVLGSEEVVPSLKTPEIFYAIVIKSSEQVITPTKRQMLQLNAVSREKKKVCRAAGSSRTQTAPQETSSVLVQLSERLLPPQLLCSTKLRLNKHIDISHFQSRPAPPTVPKHIRRRTKTAEPNKAVIPATSNRLAASRPFLNATSLDHASIMRCGCLAHCRCEELMQYVCLSELQWFVQNVTKEDAP